MSIFEKQIEKYGDTCKWLTCDSYCRMTECILYRMRIDVLFDRIKQLGLKHPEVAYEFHKSYCDMCNDDFEKRGDFKDDYDEKTDCTKSEVESEEIAKKEFADDNLVRNLYFKLKKSYCGKYIGKHKEEIKKLEEMLIDEECSDGRT